jgi:Zn-dependent protease
MTEGVPVARLFGIEIRISVAWVALLAVVIVLGADQAGRIAPELGAPARWAIGGAVAVSFLLSVLVHELAHAVTARRRGVDPGPVVLGFFGGLAPLEVQGTRPRDELVIALAGPGLSLVLALLCLAATVPLGSEGFSGAVGAGFLVIGGLNGVLAILSLLPGMPLDGGRVIRALAWARTDDQHRASVVTALVGRATGWVLGSAGVLVALTVRPAEGLMVLSLGWFLAAGARALQRRSAVQELLRGVPVSAVMERDLPQLTGSLTLDTFADRFGGPEGATSLAVVADEVPQGVVGIQLLKRIGRKAWPATRAEDVMARPPTAPFLAPDDPVWAALETLQRTGLDGLAVVEEGRLAGILTRRAAAEAIRDRVRTGLEA